MGVGFSSTRKPQSMNRYDSACLCEMAGASTWRVPFHLTNGVNDECLFILNNIWKQNFLCKSSLLDILNKRPATQQKPRPVLIHQMLQRLFESRSLLRCRCCCRLTVAGHVILHVEKVSANLALFEELKISLWTDSQRLYLIGNDFICLQVSQTTTHHGVLHILSRD